MFNNTADALKKTARNFRMVCGAATLLTQIIYITYLIICLASATGNKVTNICMLVLALVYFLYSLAVLIFDKAITLRRTKRRAKRIYSLMKHLVQISMIIVSLSNMAAANPDLKPISVLICTVMIIFFIVQLFFEMLSWLIISRIASIKNAFTKDLGSNRIGTGRAERIGVRSGDIFADENSEQ